MPSGGTVHTVVFAYGILVLACVALVTLRLIDPRVLAFRAVVAYGLAPICQGRLRMLSCRTSIAAVGFDVHPSATLDIGEPAMPADLAIMESCDVGISSFLAVGADSTALVYHVLSRGTAFAHGFLRFVLEPADPTVLTMSCIFRVHLLPDRAVLAVRFAYLVLVPADCAQFAIGKVR
jgi:hypothetical protein